MAIYITKIARGDIQAGDLLIEMWSRYVRKAKAGEKVYAVANENAQDGQVLEVVVMKDKLSLFQKIVKFFTGLLNK